MRIDSVLLLGLVVLQAFQPANCSQQVEVRGDGSSSRRQSGWTARAKQSGTIRSAGVATPYLARARGRASLTDRSRKGSGSSADEATAQGRPRSYSHSGGGGGGGGGGATAVKSPDFDYPLVRADGFLDHGLSVMTGLPAFKLEMCKRLPSSFEWFKEVTTLEDLLRNGDQSRYWDMCYAIECSVNVGPPLADAILNRATMLLRIGELTAHLATLEYALRVSPGSPKVMESLASGLMEFSDQPAGSAEQNKQRATARREGMSLFRQLAAVSIDSLDNGKYCFELAGVRRHAGDLRGEIQALTRAVELEPWNAGYGGNLLTAVNAFSVEEIRKLHGKFSKHSRNYHLWSRAPKDLPLQPIDDWLAGYPGSLASNDYTTESLLGGGYARPSTDHGGKLLRGWYTDSALHEIVKTIGTAQTEVRARLEALLAPEQPEVCRRVDKLCEGGHATFLYSLATTKDSKSITQTRDETGQSTLEFSSITPEVLGVRGSPFGNEWSNHTWPKFPLFMVNAIRSICDCADLPCDVHSKAWMMDADAVRLELQKAEEQGPKQLQRLVNLKDSLGYTPVAHAMINNDALTFAAFLETSVVDFSSKDQWGRSLVQLFYLLTPTSESRAMHDAASRFLRAAGGPPLPPLLTPRQLPKFPGMDVAEGWDAPTRTLPWPPVSEWTHSSTVDDVDASKVSWADIVDKYISVGRPVVIKGALRDCVPEMKQWSKANIKKSILSNVTFRAFSGEKSSLATLTQFVDSYFSTGELADDSEPRYIFAQQSSTVMESHMRNVTRVDFITDMLQCVPYEVQEYFALAPPELPGAWSQYTLSMGGAGAGASMHMHEAAINFVIYGTRKWYVYPPTHSTYTSQPMFQWVRDVYPNLEGDQRPLEFLQESGDIVYLPAWWAHGTLSIGDTLGFFKVQNSGLTKPVDGPNPVGPLYDNFEPSFRHQMHWADRSKKHSSIASVLRG